MRIIVIGAGKVGYTLAEHLTQEEHDVTVIDKEDDVIERCSGSLDVICLKGNGANAKVLLEAGVDKANIVIASTESDESNMLACLISKRLAKLARGKSQVTNPLHLVIADFASASPRYLPLHRSFRRSGMVGVHRRG